MSECIDWVQCLDSFVSINPIWIPITHHPFPFLLLSSEWFTVVVVVVMVNRYSNCYNVPVCVGVCIDCKWCGHIYKLCI